MKTIQTWSLVLLLLAASATSALALTANHNYTVKLATVAANGQQTPVTQMDAVTDAAGKLHYQFANVPDSGSTPFLMVQIIDSANQQVVRQTLVPAPKADQQLQMGVTETSSRQTAASMQALQGATGSGDAAVRAMLPLTMIPTGAIDAADAANVGQAAGQAATTFQTYMTQHGVNATQMTTFQNDLFEAMRQLATAGQNAASQTDPATMAGLYGQAGAQFMATLMTSASTAGIDPTVVSAAFDQAGQVIDNSSALSGMTSTTMAALQNSYLAGTQLRQMLAQMSSYATAMPVVGADPAQSQTFTAARTALQNSMNQAMGTYWQTFADPTTLPTANTADLALDTMTTAMQGAFNQFDQATTATTAQIDSMLTLMAGGMNSGGMMGGGMMTGSGLYNLGFGMMQTTLGGTTQNWSTMMVAASNLVASVPNLAYTPDTTALLAQFTGTAPTQPDWSQVPAGPYKSMLQLQYDLMLVHLLDMQALANLNGPPTQADLATIATQDLANRAAIAQGLAGVTADQRDALMAALSPAQFVN